MKQLLLISLLFFAIITASAQTLTLNGRILDSRSGEALPYASLYIPARQTGTLANTEGAYQLKVTAVTSADTLLVSLLGYRTYRLPLTAPIAQTTDLVVKLEPASTTLQEVVVRANTLNEPVDAEELVWEAIMRVGKNYPNKPQLLQGFYREWVREKSDLIRAEGLLEMYKPSYRSAGQDEVRLVKGRRKALFPHLINGQDTSYVPSITNGPHLGILLDVAKGANNAGFFLPATMRNYKFELTDRIHSDDREVYVISFVPRPGRGGCYYKGKLYIDRSSMALLQADYQLSAQGLRTLNNLYEVNRLPIRVENRSYLVSYQLQAGNWVMHHAQSKSQYGYYPINTKITTQMDLVITKTTGGDVKRFARTERLNVDQAFAEEIRDFDESFWGEENTIISDK